MLIAKTKFLGGSQRCINCRQLSMLKEPTIPSNSLDMAIRPKDFVVAKIKVLQFATMNEIINTFFTDTLSKITPAQKTNRMLV